MNPPSSSTRARSTTWRWLGPKALTNGSVRGLKADTFTVLCAPPLGNGPTFSLSTRSIHPTDPRGWSIRVTSSSPQVRPAFICTTRRMTPADSSSSVSTCGVVTSSTQAPPLRSSTTARAWSGK
jgi:hypothetical protein